MLLIGSRNTPAVIHLMWEISLKNLRAAVSTGRNTKSGCTQTLSVLDVEQLQAMPHRWEKVWCNCCSIKDFSRAGGLQLALISYFLPTGMSVLATGAKIISCRGEEARFSYSTSLLSVFLGSVSLLRLSRLSHYSKVENVSNVSLLFLGLYCYFQPTSSSSLPAPLL